MTVFLYDTDEVKIDLCDCCHVRRRIYKCLVFDSVIIGQYCVDCIQDKQTDLVAALKDDIVIQLRDINQTIDTLGLDQIISNLYHLQRAMECAIILESTTEGQWKSLYRSEDWHDDPATMKQISYIDSLMEKNSEKGDELWESLIEQHPDLTLQTLTKGQAGYRESAVKPLPLGMGI